MSASDPAPSASAARPRLSWNLDKHWTALTFGVLLWLELWAWWSTDPDYYLPDLFRPLAILILVVFMLAGFVPQPRLRAALRAGVLFIVASGLLLELYTALKPAEQELRITVSDDVLLRYHYTPHVLEDEVPINQFGMWDHEYTIPKPEDVYRIIAIGGSMGNDSQVAFPDRYHSKLETLLADAHPDGKKIEVINVSCEGYNTLQQVRLLEQSGLRYDPDLVVVAYQLSDPFLQHGGGRQVGNSRFLFRFLLPVNALVRGSRCGVFTPLYDNYGYALMVHNPLERLRLLAQMHDFETMVAVMPVVEEFDDEACVELYDQVMATAAEVGIDGVRVPDAFVGTPAAEFRKPEAPGDLAHPNTAGHALIAEVLAARIQANLREPQR